MVIVREQQKRYGVDFYTELRKEKDIFGCNIFYIYNTFDNPPCDDLVGFSGYRNIDDAISAFERITGVHYTEMMKIALRVKSYGNR